MKRIFGVTLAILIVMTTFCSCGGTDTGNNTTGTDENGKILEMGSHIELMDRKQEYYEMYSLQADKYSE